MYIDHNFHTNYRITCIPQQERAQTNSNTDNMIGLILSNQTSQEKRGKSTY